jgi:ATP-binding cassette subfamily B (MDR/TAP) protein 1
MAAGIGYLAFDYLMWSTIGSAMDKSSISHTLVEMGYFLAAIAIGLLFFSTLSDWLLRVVAARRCDRIKRLFVKSLLARDIEWFESQPEAVHESFLFLRDSIEVIESGIGSGYQHFIFCVSICIGGFIVSFVFSAQLSLVLLGTMPLVVAGMAVVSRFTVLAGDIDDRTFSSAAKAAMRTLRDIKTVVSFQQEEREYGKFRSILHKSKSVILRTAILTGIGQMAAQGMAVIDMGIGLLFMATVTDNGTANPKIDGSILVWVLTTMIYGGLSLGFSTEGLISMATAVDSIDKLRTKYLLSQSPESPKIQRFDFDRLDLRAEIPGSEYLVLDRGQRIAFVAPNTFDKSGIALKVLSAAGPGERISFVGNEPGIINGTIRENLLIGFPTDLEIPSDEEMDTVLNLVGLCKLLECLPERLDAIIKRGDYPPMTLAQERQISLARCILREPSLVILDRVTQGLSPEDERIMQLATRTVVERLSVKTIIVAIPDGFRDIDLFGSIFVLDAAGSVCQQGPSHEELIHDTSGTYVDLIRQNDPELLVSGNTLSSSVSVPSVAPHISEDTVGSHSRPSIRRGTAIVHRPLRFVENEKFSWRRILKLNRYFYSLIFASVCSCLVGGIPPVVIYVLSQLTEAFDTPPVYDHTKNYMTILFVLGAVMAAASFLKEAAYGRIREKTVRDMRLASMDHILHQPIDMYEAGNTPESVMSSLWRQCFSTGTVLAVVLNSSCECISWFIVAVVISFAASWKVAALSVSSMIGLLIAYYVFYRFLPKRPEDVESSIALIADALTSIRSIKAIKAEQHFVGLYLEALKSERSSLISSSFMLALFTALPFSVCPLLTSFGFWYSGVVYEKTPGLTVPHIIQTTYAVGDAGELAMYVISWLPDFVKFEQDSLKVFDLLDNDFSFDRGDVKLSKSSVESIALQNVSFSYSFSPQVLSQVSLEARRGELIGLVGPFKSGKSSILNLIQRFYDPQYGKVVVNGNTNIRDFTIKSFRGVQGAVPQQPVQIEGSVRDQVFYSEEFDEKLADKLIDICQLGDVITTSSDWNKRTKLNQCQMQRISIARALARDPTILLFDEPFSLISCPELAQRIQSNIESFRKNRITIVATTNGQCVERADRIYVVDGGHVVQSGTYQELMAQDGIFLKMARNRN